MRLSCPQCHTEYDVPDAALAGRVRTLRCSDCGTKFKAPELLAIVELAPEPPPEVPAAFPTEIAPYQEIAAEPDAVPEVAFDPVPETFEPAGLEPAPAEAAETDISYEAATALSARRAPVPPRAVLPQPEPSKPNRALGISVLLVLLVIGIVLAAHRAIGHAWPPSLRLFNALGLH